MTRLTKLILIGILIEMLLVAAGAFAWKAGLIGETAAPDGYRQLIVIGLLPVVLAIAAFRVARRFASDTRRLSDSHKRYNQQTLTLTALIFTGMQGLSAYIYVRGEAIHDPTVMRFIVVIFGLFFAVRGNFLAKLDPPTGPGAPPPAIWTRNLMRLGWCVAALGVMIVISALVLPPNAIRPVLMAAILIMLIGELAFRRAIRARI